MLTRALPGTSASRRTPAAERTRLHRRSARSIAAAAAMLLLLGLLGAPAGAARRADPGGNCPPGQENCDVWDDEPGDPGGGGDGGDDGGGGDGGGGGGPARCSWGGKTVPCYHPYFGHFNNGDGCYYKVSEPQPEAPAGQLWYTATCNGGDIGDQRQVLRAEPPPGFEAPPDPEELARRALASIRLRAPVLTVTPRKELGPGLVGLPVWMWTGRGPAYWGPLSASASERGLTVTIEAKVQRIEWRMGNGTDPITCRVPGTPYDAKGSRAGQTSPDCGYDGYPRPGTYQVNATTHWQVHWESSSGVSGDIFETRNGANVVVQINELQVVTE